MCIYINSRVDCKCGEDGDGEKKSLSTFLTLNIFSLSISKEIKTKHSLFIFIFFSSSSPMHITICYNFLILFKIYILLNFVDVIFSKRNGNFFYFFKAKKRSPFHTKSRLLLWVYSCLTAK